MDSGSDSSDDSITQFKVVVLGNGAVGKTSLIRHFCESGFNNNYKQTIGLDFYSRKVQLPHGQATVQLQLWDIGGQQIGGKMLSKYIYGSHAVCLVFDVTNMSSFKDIADWKASVDQLFTEASVSSPPQPLPRMLLVGNKMDLPARQVSEADINKYARENGLESCLVSARSGEHVNAMFTKIAAVLSGVDIRQQDLDMADNVTANVVSRPEERKTAERAPALHSTKTSAGKKSNDDCIVM